ncbi:MULTISPECIES: DUF2393 family protein [Campylobacter]|uniref:DUF2393 family protein n=1 Tax=Campylobacter magnus TaxID=3026462 RepID=A0ABT8T7F0_9BACT|nr:MULTISPECIES: DUF2393 family protein [Campylobacter]MCI7246429.1 DUF2393 domain-containing protein [Campylobacter sp.]MDD7703419.1 DUF2393 family protein [Campylobacteraceae bacterium]MDO2409612.1 DUF2393 family protein [Campylobacter magnus]MDY2635807.1 DUF2393 family protein [Campylobacter sp.]
MYFTYIHIIFIILLFIIFCLFGFLLLRGTVRLKKLIITISLLFAGFLASSTIISIIIDDYTKVAKISEVKYQRVLLKESLNFTGIISNVGGFDITSCNINIRITNSPSTLQALTPDLFKQPDRSFLDFFKIKKKEFKISTINENFTIGERLKAKSARPFSLYVRYPTTFKDPKVNYTLTCH